MLQKWRIFRFRELSYMEVQNCATAYSNAFDNLLAKFHAHLII